MRIHLLSDLHNEYDTYRPPAVDADIVILVGDIDVKARGVEWAKKAFLCPVLYVLGNHEYYSGHMPGTLEKMRSACLDSHVQVLERDAVIISGTPDAIRPGYDMRYTSSIAKILGRANAEPGQALTVPVKAFRMPLLPL